MINLTMDVVFKKEDHELKEAIKQAIIDTRQILFDQYSDGKIIPNEKIVSTNQSQNGTAKRNTHALAYCKYFDVSKFENMSVPLERFISKWHKLYTANKKPNKKEISELIPEFEKVKHQISAIFITQITRGIGIMLLSLWSQDAIILTPKFKLPSSQQGERGKKVFLCKPLYTEVLALFESFREVGANELDESTLESIKFYAWRMIIASDWHTIEKICVVDAANFLKAVADHKTQKKTFMNVKAPVNDMLSFVKNNFGERAKFTIDDFIKAREAVFGGPTQSAAINQNNPYSPYSLQQGPWHSDAVNFDLKEACAEWVSTQINYIEARKNRGMKTYPEIAKSETVKNFV